MAWKDSLSVDVVSIDREHRALAEGIEAFFVRLRAGIDRHAMVAGLDDLADVVADHFDHEERVMRNIALPDYALHRQLHAALLDEVRLFREEVHLGINDRPVEVVEHFLHSWLFKHIAAEDQKISDHLNR
jgi:hemerythrin